MNDGILRYLGGSAYDAFVANVESLHHLHSTDQHRQAFASYVDQEQLERQWLPMRQPEIFRAVLFDSGSVKDTNQWRLLSKSRMSHRLLARL